MADNSQLKSWTKSTLTGAGVGAVVGFGFHMVAGPTAIVIGQPNLRMKMFVRNGALAAVRMAGVFSIWTGTRHALEHNFDLPSYVPSAVGGALAVAIPTAMTPARQEFLQHYFRESGTVFKVLPSRVLVIATSAVSGAITLGGVDLLLKYAGLRW